MSEMNSPSLALLSTLWGATTRLGDIPKRHIS
jgi:hypothetical protein